MTRDLADDRRQQREWLLSLAGPPRGVFVDLGCGTGEDLRLLGAQHPAADVRLIGVDAHAPAVTIAIARMEADSRFSFQHARLDGRLPFEDGSVDIVYSHNLLECLADRPAFAREVARILRPGGQVVLGHWDWDSQLYDGTDKDLVRRLVHAYADWEQAWMGNADGWMGRRLWGVFNATGLFDGKAEARVLTNTVYAAPQFGYENAQAFRSLVKRGLAGLDDCHRFEQEQVELDAQGRYFYSITGYAYVGRRRTV
jgi:SAM-dependent methyltransferase